MLDQVASARVGTEALGIARAFRSEVKLIDVTVEKALATATAPLRARLKRHPKLRPAMLPDFARSYADLIPARFRFGKLEAATHKTDIAMRERRLCVSWLTDDLWNNPDAREQGVTICEFAVFVRAGKLQQHWLPLINVSLHALARRVERGLDRSSEALERDIAVLAEAGDDGEKVPTEGGHWLGAMTNANDSDTGRTIRIRNVRTWIDDDG